MEMKNPPIEWRAGVPYSPEFGDIYYTGDPALGGAMAESEYVFLRGNRLPERWKSLCPYQPFVIGETGFGSGLNFIVTALSFLENAPPMARLHYISCEKFPLKAADIDKALRPCLANHEPALSLLDELLTAYPPPLSGAYRILLHDRMTLTLVFDDVSRFSDYLAAGALWPPWPSGGAAGGMKDSGVTDLNRNLYNRPLAHIWAHAWVHAWYLDGFMPSANPGMWNPELFQKLRSVSHPSATLSTFTAAGQVRRDLQKAGFYPQKRPGFGKKREMLTATATEINHPATGDDRRGAGAPPYLGAAKTKPWLDDPSFFAAGFSNGDLPKRDSSDAKPSAKERQKKRRALIIGGGLAGCAMAEALARRGVPSVIFEENSDIALGASGNPRGIFAPVIHADDTAPALFSRSAFFYLLSHLRRLKRAGLDTGFLQTGLLQAGKEKNQGKEDCADSYFRFVNAVEASEIAGVSVNRACRFFPLAGSLSPRKLCLANLELAQSYPIESPHKQALPGMKIPDEGAPDAGTHGEKNPNVKIQTGVKIVRLERLQKEGATSWVLTDSLGNTHEGDLVILANSYGATLFEPAAWLPLSAFRGQLFYLPQTPATARLRVPVNAEAYMIPAENDRHVLGATFEQVENAKDGVLRPEENADIARRAALVLPFLGSGASEEPEEPGEKEEKPRSITEPLTENRDREKKSSSFSNLFEQCGGRVSFRSAAVDHRPLIGALPERETYLSVFAPLQNGPRAARDAYEKLRSEQSGSNAPDIWLRGLYTISGLGSRGILYSQLGAEWLASLILGEPLPVERSVAHALCPARFLARQLRQAES